MKVMINEPKNMQSDAKNAHISILLCEIPVVVACASSRCATCCV